MPEGKAAANPTIRVAAPGRLELLGNHTDYNQGLVLGVAIGRRLQAKGSLSVDGFVRLSSENFPETIEVQLDELRRLSGSHWANYPIGIVREWIAAGYSIGGFSAEFSGDLPAGRGLASSAALEMATALLLKKLFRLQIPPLTLARFGQRAENDFVGVQSGIFDQLTCLCAEAGQVVCLDCRSEKVRLIPFPAQVALVVASCSEPRELVAGLYNQRRAECAAAATALKVSSLRELTPETLAACRLTIPPALRQRARHVVEENRRVAEAIDALIAGDIFRLGRLLNASHESSRLDFENSTEALDRLAEHARSLPGVLGARLTGGGFGGAVLVLVEARRAEEIVAALRQFCPEKEGTSESVWSCQPAAGALALAW